MITNFVLNNWQRKVIAIITAVFIWLLVNHFIVETKVLRNVPVRIVNLPPKKTISGLQPNGYLKNRISLTLSGPKKILNELESGDLEVLLDSTVADSSDEWSITVSPKDIISLTPTLDLKHQINNISHPEFTIKFTPLVVERIPIRIQAPHGNPPEGYEFLDISPRALTQTVSGPQEEVELLKYQGLPITFDLTQVHAADLENLKSSHHHSRNDEISYLVPASWKRISSPQGQLAVMEINDPDAKHLKISFLKKGYLPLGKAVPVEVFYPMQNIQRINPKSFPLELNSSIKDENGITTIAYPLFVKDVSKLFLDIVRDYITIVIIASPNDRKSLDWSIEVINAKELENTYVAFLMSEATGGKKQSHPEINEDNMRKRFRDYLQKLSLYKAEGQELKLNPTIADDKIVLIDK